LYLNHLTWERLMEDRKPLAPTAASEHGTALAAIELSGCKWVVSVQRPGAARPSVYHRPARDLAWLVALISELGAAGLRVVFCYEAGRDGFWLQRALTAAGGACHIIEPASLPIDRRKKRAKTDRLDVFALLRALGLWLAGDRQACRIVRVPTPAVEDARRLYRERQRLMKECTQHENRVGGLLALHGIAGFRAKRADRWAELAALRDPLGAPVPPQLAAEIARELRRLELVLEQLAAVEAARDAAIKQPAPADPVAGKIAQLVRLKAIGAELATALGREVYWRRFNNGRQVGSYVGLPPCPWRSGGMTGEQGISKAGNPRARKSAIELAWLWLRWQPQSELAQWFQRRLGGAKGRLKRILIVALARKLVVALWRYLETGQVPSGAALKA
jgi:transposase